MSFQYLKKTCYSLGIDLGNSHLTGVFLSHRKNHVRVLHTFNHCIDPLLIGNAREEKIIDLLAKSLAAIKNKPQKTVIAISYHATIFRTLEMDSELKEDEIFYYLEQNSKKIFESSMDEIYMDFSEKKTDKKQEKSKIIYCMASKKMDIDAKIYLFKRAGVIIKMVDVDVLALKRMASLFSDHLGINVSKISFIHWEDKNFMILMFEKNGDFSVHPFEKAEDGIFLLGECISKRDHSMDLIFLSGHLSDNDQAKKIQEIIKVKTILMNPFDFLEKEQRIEIENSGSYVMSFGLAMRGVE